MEICFWYDWSEHKLVVIDPSTKKRKEITNQKKIDRFFEVYQLRKQDCKGVHTGTDRLGLFGGTRIIRRFRLF